MRINTIINRYILRELVSPFAISLTVLTFIFLMTKILEITNLIVNYHIGIGSVMLMLFYSMPFFLIFTIPMSVMIGVLLTFLRMSGDNEIVALKAGGQSTYALAPPVLLFCVAGAVVTCLVSVYGLPKGRVAFKTLAYEVATANVNLGLKERTFNDRFDGVVLYVNRIDIQTRELIDVFIEDQRTPGAITTVVAPRGKIFSDPEKMVFQLRLFDGSIHQIDLPGRTGHSTRFETYDVRLDIKQVVTVARGGPKDEEEMSLAELRAYVDRAVVKDDRYYLTLMEFHKKFSIPFSCIALGILALPLGIQTRSAKRSYGVILSLTFFLVYYMMLSAGWVFGEAGVYPPVVGMWMPNLVMGGIGLFLLRRMAQERPFHMVPFLRSLFRLPSRRA
ncbi:MAG: LPS export ABC transporter permease LptF [Desulfobacterales bacterium]|nr:LPS export ABC transporter permease LptF [Desulfobacterales bacterium]